MTLAWSKDDAPAEVWENAFQVHLRGDHQFHNYVINGRNMLKRGLQPGRRAGPTVRASRPTVSGTDVDIDFIRFLSKRSRYLAAPNGAQYETLGGEMRKILYMLPEQTLEWTINVPAGRLVRVRQRGSAGPAPGPLRGQRRGWTIGPWSCMTRPWTAADGWQRLSARSFGLGRKERQAATQSQLAIPAMLLSGRARSCIPSLSNDST